MDANLIVNARTVAANMRHAFIDRRGAKIGGGNFTPEELRDAAILLNAAPDMLEALQWALVFCEAIERTGKHAPCETLRAAIEKATGCAK